MKKKTNGRSMSITNVDELKKAHGAFRSFDLYNAKAKIEALGLPMNGGAKKFFDSL